MLEAIEKKNRRKRWRLSREMFERRIPRATPRASACWISRRRIGSILDGDVDSTASSCARNLLPSLGRFLMLQHRNWWKEWLECLLFKPFRQAFRRLTKAYSGGLLACCSSWNIVFHELILPLTELRHIPPFTGPVWATQMVSSVPLYAGVAPSWWSLCVPGSWWPDGFWPFSQWCWILEILLSRKKILRNLIWLTGRGLIPTTE